MTTGLDSLNLSMFDCQPALLPDPAVAAQGPILFTLKQTRFGRTIMVCESDPAPASVIERSRKDKVPLFTGAEVARLAGIPDELVEKIIQIKLQWPGATVSSFLADSGEVS